MEPNVDDGRGRRPDVSGHEPPRMPAVQPMRAAAILGSAFGLYRRHWRTLLPIVVLAVPLAVSIPTTRALATPGNEYQVVVHHRVVATGGSWAGDRGRRARDARRGARPGGGRRGGHQGRRGRRGRRGPRRRRSYRFAVGRVWPLFLALALTWLLTMLGFVLFVVPGVVVGVLLAVSIPALVVEGTRVRDALVRSWNLVGGHWWHSFGALLLTWLLLGLTVSLLDNAVGGLGYGWLAETVAQALSITLVTPVAVLVAVLLYRPAGPEGIPGRRPAPLRDVVAASPGKLPYRP